MASGSGPGSNGHAIAQLHPDHWKQDEGIPLLRPDRSALPLVFDNPRRFDRICELLDDLLPVQRELRDMRDALWSNKHAYERALEQGDEAEIIKRDAWDYADAFVGRVNTAVDRCPPFVAKAGPHNLAAYFARRLPAPEGLQRNLISRFEPVRLRLCPPGAGDQEVTLREGEWVILGSDASHKEIEAVFSFITEAQRFLGYPKDKGAPTPLADKPAESEQLRTAAKLYHWQAFDHLMIAQFFGWITPESSKADRKNARRRAERYVERGEEVLTREMGADWWKVHEKAPALYERVCLLNLARQMGLTKQAG